MKRNIAVAFALLVITAAADTVAHAQATPLASIDSLIATSRFRDAAAALDRWERDNASTVTPAERATAMLLRARLIQDADSARDTYLSLSLTYPSSPEAAVALLRLGQLAFAADDRTRAASYFQRIISDHPRAAVHPDAVAWLARTRDNAPTNAASSTTAGTTRPAPAKPAPARPTPARPTPARQDAPDGASAQVENGAFSLQVGAFRTAATAQTVVRQLSKAGFQARAVTVPANQLVRVRVGRFANARAADDTMRRLRTAGFEAVVVNDARSESAAAR